MLHLVSGLGKFEQSRGLFGRRAQYYEGGIWLFWDPCGDPELEKEIWRFHGEKLDPSGRQTSPMIGLPEAFALISRSLVNILFILGSVLFGLETECRISTNRGRRS
jgi:hypothetical protein